MKRIAFPGLGLEFNIDPTAFTVFGIEIQWYGIILTLGILGAFFIFWRLGTKKEALSSDSVFDYTLFIVPISIIGARFVYVVTEWENYKGTGLLNIINIRNGGIAIYGAIIFGLITILIMSKIKKLSALSVLDAVAPAVLFGQIIGRWGNFVNAEAYGWSSGVDKLPWRMELDYVRVDGIYISDHFPYTASVHPTFLYESLWNLIGLVIILAVLYRKKKFNGEIFFAYLGWYGLGRGFIEMLRADSLYIIEPIKFSVVVGFGCVIASIIGFFVLAKRNSEEKRELAGYTPAFESVRVAVENEADSLDQSVFETEEEEPSEEEELDDEDAEVLAEQDLLDGDIDELNEEQTEE